MADALRLGDLSASQREQILTSACDRFLAGENRTEIGRELGKILNLPGPLDRRAVNRLFDQARREGLIRIATRSSEENADLLCKLYRIEDTDSVQVALVRPTDPDPLALLGARAAEWLVNLIQKDAVAHIGWTSGKTSMYCARALADIVRYDDRLPELSLHAINSGFDPKDVSTSPTYFFGFFRDAAVKVTEVGLFSAPLVYARDYNDVIKLPGVREGFEAKDEIEYVVTSCGSADSSENHRKNAIKRFGGRDLVEQDVVGDLAFRSYSRDRFLLEDEFVSGAKIDGLRAVSLFELSELRDRVADKSLKSMLVVGPSSSGSKWKSVRPLLKNPNLKVWSHLIIDTRTAMDLIEHAAD